MPLSKRNQSEKKLNTHSPTGISPAKPSFSKTKSSVIQDGQSTFKDVVNSLQLNLTELYQSLSNANQKTKFNVLKENIKVMTRKANEAESAKSLLKKLKLTIAKEREEHVQEVTS